MTLISEFLKPSLSVSAALTSIWMVGVMSVLTRKGTMETLLIIFGIVAYILLSLRIGSYLSYRYEDGKHMFTWFCLWPIGLIIFGEDDFKRISKAIDSKSNNPGRLARLLVGPPKSHRIKERDRSDLREKY